MGWIFNAALLDGIAVVLLLMLVAAVVVGIVDIVPAVHHRTGRVLRKRLGRWIPVMTALLALFLTYATVRLQTRLAADVAYDEIGSMFVQDELANSHFRCLYNWHAHSTPVQCRSDIVSSSEKYSETMLYIEEVLFLLESAKKDKAIWGTQYAEDIEFWMKDVSDDPTGMFSYGIVVENPTDPSSAVEAAGLKISPERLCKNYSVVWEHLRTTGGNPAPKIECR